MKDVNFNKGYSRFVDCGAFNGDTAFMIKEEIGQIEKIALFEPDINNFNQLIKNIKQNHIAKEHILFPCGVWNNNEIKSFVSGKDSISSISTEGNVYVQCVVLDDVLIGFNPTFIKMDIEGAEVEALLGAQDIIKECAPDLAISVYHKIEHMWEIPLLIKDINPNYKLYLRSHGLRGMETILYAT
ncbi:FkbM family methyltransferase [Caloramator sp. mosi_1]|uniref:FkbM family methyltransferase n=1 Tax=Caloramator sp. mosi_1 TaxID=3023090 RepID=UPI00235DCF9A|nr:FkbM family methyltransferase [Caloramator sp. mosi_1]WDC85739.1 FkbM family methyltransferase [Caloramator sp. mosi_1]